MTVLAHITYAEVFSVVAIFAAGLACGFLLARARGGAGETGATQESGRR
jgi:hypothetical protein